MNCDMFLDRYLLLDKHGPLSIGLRMHFLRCKSCRDTVKRLSAAENVQRRILRIPVATDTWMLNATMSAIYMLNKQTVPVAARQRENKTLLQWLIVGTLLIVGFILLPFSGIGKIGLSPFGDSFWIPFALLCAGCVIAYFAVFLAKNLVFFTEKFTRQA